MRNKFTGHLRFLLLSIILSGCAGAQWDQVQEKRHFVRSGENLYFIALRYGLKYQDLLLWNQISDGEIILPGQIIKLSSPVNNPIRVKSVKASKAPKAIPKKINSNSQWIKPTQGDIKRRFNNKSKVFRGILLSGDLGQAVSASSDGRVVYAGDGLVGYGQLVIIKHNDVFLSAYGYNDSVFVEEGDFIRKGQKIASMGLSPEDVPRLYFEVRRSGNPIDPISLFSGS